MRARTIGETSAILMVLVVVGSCAAMASAEDVSESEVTPSSALIYVPDNYSKIHWAVDNATAGDTIIVRDGTYIENIEVDKSLTIRSENGSENGSASTIVQAFKNYNPTIKVTADYVNISGFTVKVVTLWGKGGIGIYLDCVDHCNISDNTASNIEVGIYLSSSSNNVLMNNTALNNNHGIRLISSSNNSLRNNTASKNSVTSIFLSSSSNNVLMNNTASENNYGSILLQDSSNNVLMNNTVLNNNYGIRLISSSNNRIFLNNFINNRNNVESVNSNNIWNSEEKMTYIYNGSIYTNYLGNYWSDYKGSDANNNGIGDASYIICPDEDNYPLMKRFENYFNFTTENQPPIASFTYYPENPVVNQTITFNASSSTDPDGTVENYEWDFGDGEKAEGKIITHSYSSAGNYTVKLTVTDNKGATNSTAQVIHVGVAIATTVSVKSPTEISEGENFTATVNIDVVSDLAILMFKLTYNSSVMELTNVEKGSDISSSGWSQWNSVGYSGAGALKVFAVSDPSGLPINGSAKLARLEFTVVGEAGDKSVIDIKGILGNSAVESIQAIWVGSEVAVMPA